MIRLPNMPLHLPARASYARAQPQVSACDIGQTSGREMSTASAHAEAFYRKVASGKSVWTVRDAGGFPAPQLSDGRRAQPFWSTRSRAERVIGTVDAYREFELHEIPADVFLERWLPGLERDGILVGVDWACANATGYDIGADEVRANIASCLGTRK